MEEEKRPEVEVGVVDELAQLRRRWPREDVEEVEGVVAR